MKVLTLVGTRPEIIRLSRVISLFDEVFNHVLVHTGQNWDPELKDVFFDDLNLRKPDFDLAVDTTSLASTLAGIFTGLEAVIQKEKPDAFLVLGDTNSALGLIIAKRMGVPTYHMEAGNRCFDENVPEETNRRIVDHAADFNCVYTEHARRNLLSEGIRPRYILHTGSPMREVLNHYKAEINESQILNSLSLKPTEYFLVSAHRQETVDNPVRLRELLNSLQALAKTFGHPVVVSTHPRTKKRMAELDLEGDFAGIQFLEPFGFLDYNKLQMNARCVLSDSGTISEESSILSFPAITLRASIERPEALDSGSIVLADVSADQVMRSVEFAISSHDSSSTPVDYMIDNTSHRMANFVMSTAHLYPEWAGLRG